MSDQQGNLFDAEPPQWELDAAGDQLVATVVFPEAPRGEFDYLVPQELAAISLDVSRNSMIAVDIRLAMLNLGVASSACIFGAMGE